MKVKSNTDTRKKDTYFQKKILIAKYFSITAEAVASAASAVMAAATAAEC